MQERAAAKVNLYLHVTGRRPDGYHTLDSLAVFADVGDALRATAAEALTLQVEGSFGAGLDAGEGNLVMRAARALHRAAGVSPGAAIRLEKALPVASGIGGGSADAAAALRLLSGLWGFALPPAGLAAVAAELGADVPVCLLSAPSRMGGVGDLLGVAPSLPAYGLALVNPGIEVSTAAVFGARDGGFSEAAVLPARWGDAAEMAAGLRTLRNDLEEPATALCPAVADVLAWLRAQPGCLLARMSGSGSTCFGLFGTARRRRRPWVLRRRAGGAGAAPRCNTGRGTRRRGAGTPKWGCRWGVAKR